MIKPKDILEALFYAFLVFILVFLAGFLETAPLGISMWVAAILGAMLWAVWLGLVIRERIEENKPLVTDPLLWISDGEKWVAMDGSGKTKPFATRRERREETLFDQEDFDESR